MNFQKELQAHSRKQKKSNKKPKKYFGQASLEFIILLAAGLAALGAIIVSINSIVETSDFALGTIQSRSTTQQLTHAINTVALLGSGNTINLKTNLTKGQLLLETQTTNQNQTTKKELCSTFTINEQKKKTCFELIAKIESLPKTLEFGKTTIKIENKNGKITLKTIN